MFTFLNLTGFGLLSDKVYLLLLLFGAILTLIMSLTPSLESLGLKKIDEKYIFILFTAIILGFYVLDPSFYIIFVLYLVYIIRIILRFINYKPKSEVSKMVASQLATVEIHYDTDMRLIRLFSRYARFVFLLTLTYNHYSEYGCFSYIYCSFANIWFITINEFIIKVGGNPFSRLFGKIALTKGAKLASSLAVPTVTTGITIYALDANNKLHATGADSDYTSTSLSWLLGDSTSYQLREGLIPYSSNLGRDCSHAFNNSDPSFSKILVDSNGDQAPLKKTVINGPKTLEEMRKNNVALEKIEGTSNLHFVYKDKDAL